LFFSFRRSLMTVAFGTPLAVHALVESMAADVKRKSNSRRRTWLLVGAGAAMVAGRLMERGLDSGWRAWKDEEPPTFKRGDSWSQALAWTALSAAAVATAELVARRSAHLGLAQMTGKRAPAGL
jgi:hypothetical protein